MHTPLWKGVVECVYCMYIVCWVSRSLVPRVELRRFRVDYHVCLHGCIGGPNCE
jgi:hypothetical protein